MSEPLRLTLADDGLERPNSRSVDLDLLDRLEQQAVQRAQNWYYRDLIAESISDLIMIFLRHRDYVTHQPTEALKRVDRILKQCKRNRRVCVANVIHLLKKDNKDIDNTLKKLQKKKELEDSMQERTEVRQLTYDEVTHQLETIERGYEFQVVWDGISRTGIFLKPTRFSGMTPEQIREKLGQPLIFEDNVPSHKVAPARCTRIGNTTFLRHSPKQH
jgi:hypothetical protein